MSLDVDFERKVFSGTVNLMIDKLDKNVNEVVRMVVTFKLRMEFTNLFIMEGSRRKRSLY